MKRSVTDMIEWFKSEYEDPAQGVPYNGREGGYQYVNGGPYNPIEVLPDKFEGQDEEKIDEAVEELLLEGHEWVRRGDY